MSENVYLMDDGRPNWIAAAYDLAQLDEIAAGFVTPLSLQMTFRNHLLSLRALVREQGALELDDPASP